MNHGKYLFQIEIGHNDVTSLLYQESEKSVKQYLKEVVVKGLIDYWNWKEFIIRSIYILI